MNSLNKLKNEAQQIRLSAQEKDVMRAALFGTPSPVALQKSPYVTVSHYQWFSARFVTAMAAFMVVVLGGGSVYASQAALPGDALYTVKVSVAEPVRTALAFSDEAKLFIHTDIAEERLEEAQALAAEGRLSADAAAQIETSLETHVKQAETLALKVEELNPDVAGEVSATLEAALSVNSAILASLGDESDDRDTKQNSHSLAIKTQSRLAYAQNVGGMGDASQAMTMMAPGAEASDRAAFMVTNTTTEDAAVSAKMAPAPAMAPVAATATEAQIRVSDQYEKKAEKAVSDVKTSFGKLKASYDTQTATRINVELTSLSERLTTGDEMEAMGDYAATKELYIQVNKDAVALSTFLKAEQKFNKNILNALINERFGVRALETGVQGGVQFEVQKGEVQGTTTNDDNGGEQDRNDRTEDGDDRNSGKKEEESSKGSVLPVKVDLGL
ncbi:MAG: hypothetical protein KBD50_02075 [Candidatus Pacebacteria bacterium]|nr:hypothetical protein [Candidatus Paceibacterota bacterium]